VPVNGTPAAVLIGLVAHPEGPSVILTQRTAHLKNHPAEISFPGGHIEEADGSPEVAALREAWEEIGLPPSDVELLGSLPAHRTISDFRVSPIVGWIDKPVAFAPDVREVADVFEVPLEYVLDRANHLQGVVYVGGERHRNHVLPYQGRRIWGATAEMLLCLAEVLGGPGGPR
jgi:8-oxo-dGTP pyrophosphatase MutT (NUDIX family)